MKYSRHQSFLISTMLLSAALLLSSCQTPQDRYDSRATELRAAYEAKQITFAEYQQLLNQTDQIRIQEEADQSARTAAAMWYIQQSQDAQNRQVHRTTTTSGAPSPIYNNEGIQVGTVRGPRETKSYDYYGNEIR